MPKAANGAGERFIEATLGAEATNECILWPLSMRNGYGALGGSDRKTRYAHRVVCERAHGKPPAAMDAAHSCGNRACVNPAHLRWATRKDNLADTVGHGTRPRGSRHGMSRLTDEQATAVLKNEEGLGSTEWGRRLNIEPSAISAIWAGRRWAHLGKENQ